MTSPLLHTSTFHSPYLYVEARIQRICSYNHDQEAFPVIETLSASKDIIGYYHSMNTRTKGALREEAAARFLSEHGFVVTDRNFRTRQGEIDIVGRDGKYLVFVEVKYRSSVQHGAPSEAVTPAKQKKIRKTAMYYLYEHGFPETVQVRYDVVEIIRLEDKKHYIRWLKNAFW